MHPTVLVSGAGIAGSALAFLLARRGFRPTLVERARELRSSGTPVDVEGAAFDVTEQMGVVPQLRERATRVQRLVFVDRAGHRVAHMDMGINGPRWIEIARGDLSRILYEAARAEAEVLFGDSIVTLEQDAAGVNVTFERAEPRRFDYVVGCDGLHSTVRRLAFGPEDRFLRNLGLYVATFPLDGPSENPHEVLVCNVSGRAISIHPGTGRAIAALIYRDRADPVFDPRDAVDHRRRLEAAFGDAGWRSRELLDRLRIVDDFYFDAVSRVQLARWSRGRVAVLGDAASCVSFLGGGSSNALAGAAVLADALAASPRDAEAAFTRYERTHRKRVDPKQRGVGLASHLLVPASAAEIAVRNVALRVLSTLRRAPAVEPAARPASSRHDASV
jgi:2-polyprenyl-6-methoxyphenol hydroxylase-like FAD-dependent oxidoreductase